MNPSAELTILMPCLNEAETLGSCIAKARDYLDRHQIVGEILVADNGSEDGSRQIAEDLGARLIVVEERGYGSALKAGIQAAHGRYIIMGDSDDSYDFSNLDLFVERLRDGADLVMGNRFLGGIEPGAMPFLHRYLGNPVLSFLARSFFGISIGDFHCGLRGMNRAAILDIGLCTPGMEFASEMVVKASLSGLEITEVPTKLSKDGRSRAPHLNTWRDGWRHLRFLLLFSPRWLFLYPSLFVLTAGLFLTLILVPGTVQVMPGVTLDIHSLLVASFVTLFSVQGLSFALLARYFAHVRGILPGGKNIARIMSWWSLEKVLLLSGLLLIGGIAGFAVAIAEWIATDLGPLEYGSLVKSLVLSGLAIAVSIQIAFTGFLLAVMDIDDGRKPQL